METQRTTTPWRAGLRDGLIPRWRPIARQDLEGRPPRRPGPGMETHRTTRPGGPASVTAWSWDGDPSRDKTWRAISQPQVLEQEPMEKTSSPLGGLCGLCERCCFFIRVHLSPSVVSKTSPQPGSWDCLTQKTLVSRQGRQARKGIENLARQEFDEVFGVRGCATLFRRIPVAGTFYRSESRRDEARIAGHG